MKPATIVQCKLFRNDGETQELTVRYWNTHRIYDECYNSPYIIFDHLYTFYLFCVSILFLFFFFIAKDSRLDI